MKKFFVFLLAAALILGAVLPASAAEKEVTSADFTDVAEDSWYQPYVLYVCRNGLMLGVDQQEGKIVFDPEGTADRAMIATIFWRMEGSPEPSAPSGFADVPEGQWFSQAIAWAKEADVVNGKPGNLYGTEDPVTREELAAICCRYAQHTGKDLGAPADIGLYDDSSQVQDWAKESVSLLIGSGILNGKEGNRIDPGGTATRAEIAAILERFIEGAPGPEVVGSYEDDTGKITITKEWFHHAWVYEAHLQFTDYTRFSTQCANGAYGAGKETTTHAAQRLGAIFAVNGCYSAPEVGNTVIRDGIIWNKHASHKNRLYAPGVYSSVTGLLQSADEGRVPGLGGKDIDELVASGQVTDTFCFGGAFLRDGEIRGSTAAGSTQTTLIGTNGEPGDIWIMVAEGRLKDGVSTGLSRYECAILMQSKGCILGIPLDGGWSSTMYFNGKVLNSSGVYEREIVDFVVFR